MPPGKNHTTRRPSMLVPREIDGGVGVVVGGMWEGVGGDGGGGGDGMRGECDGLVGLGNVVGDGEGLFLEGLEMGELWGRVLWNVWLNGEWSVGVFGRVVGELGGMKGVIGTRSRVGEWGSGMKGIADGEGAPCGMWGGGGFGVLWGMVMVLVLGVLVEKEEELGLEVGVESLVWECCEEV
ncbi:hypothetical protein Tco_0743224 [Tanacetum coccineum]